MRPAPKPERPKVKLAQVPKKGASAFHVFDGCCKNCLYGSKPIVSRGRIRGIKARVRRDGVHFICHVAMLQGKDVACAAWAAQDGAHSNLYRIALRLGSVQLVEQPEGEALPSHDEVSKR